MGCDKNHTQISRFIFDEAEKLGLEVNEINITIEPNFKDDKYVDLVISDTAWNELVKYKVIV